MKIVLFAVLLLLLLYLINRAYKNTKDIVLNKIKINSADDQGNGPVLNILQLSDLHLENISISPAELYEKLKNEKIDFIALTGDFLDRKRTIPKLIPYLKVLNELNAEHGMYAVLGNHDYVLRGENLTKLKTVLEQNGVTVLQNENTVIDVHGQPVNIIGIDDFSTGRSNLAASYKDMQSGTNLVLTHDPNIVLHMDQFHFDYLLAGHFHGGQICYPKAYHLVKMGKLVRMNMIKGLHMQNGKPFYINEGLGQTGVNIRIGSRPEITLHQLSVSTLQTQSLSAM
ncbi:metallophosphoesterase [Bacillus sp. V5-8f]|uniref:metallophosphoesterase n=1 Tax=Bacillus sp. V5-8f TaxID=2053044 RepID=UPI000C778A55|nr:metallophosphoesterase [Bacillus sp. V5-8f]PLT35647.1 metallophosphoesterase [Bacillus sp. V5-8f]